MNIFPLQSELIEAVVGFINADLREPKDVQQYFNGTWQPDKLPTLRTCRELQKEVRQWLLEAKLGSADHMPALYGYGSIWWQQVDQGIQLEGKIYLEIAPQEDLNKNPIAWSWQVSNASLRSICGLAVATTCQEGLHHKVHECKRDRCENIFIDRHSRGKPRLYCQSTECANKRNSAAVKKSRKNPEKAKKPRGGKK